MMREQVNITPVIITKAGQVNYFQIKLPKNAKHIIGIELGGKFLTDSKVKKTAASAVATEIPATNVELALVAKDTALQPANVTLAAVSETRATAFKRNVLVGELKLQSCEEANIFYAGELRIDNNMSYGDFSKTATWKLQSFTHQTLTLEDEVKVDADSTIIQGMYKDNLGLETKRNVNYQVNVYVWYSF